MKKTSLSIIVILGLLQATQIFCSAFRTFQDPNKDRWLDSSLFVRVEALRREVSQNRPVTVLNDLKRNHLEKLKELVEADPNDYYKRKMINAIDLSLRNQPQPSSAPLPQETEQLQPANSEPKLNSPTTQHAGRTQSKALPYVPPSEQRKKRINLVPQSQPTELTPVPQPQPIVESPSLTQPAELTQAPQPQQMTETQKLYLEGPMKRAERAKETLKNLREKQKTQTDPIALMILDIAIAASEDEIKMMNSALKKAERDFDLMVQHQTTPTEQQSTQP